MEWVAASVASAPRQCYEMQTGEHERTLDGDEETESEIQ